jgi:hypothetical protein
VASCSINSRRPNAAITTNTVATATIKMDAL